LRRLHNVRGVDAVDWSSHRFVVLVVLANVLRALFR